MYGFDSVALRCLICIRKWEADMPTSSHKGQNSSVGNDIPGQRQGNVLVCPREKTELRVRLQLCHQRIGIR